MKIVINTKSSIIPIEINGKQFEFDTSDENVTKLEKAYIESLKEIEKNQDNDEKLIQILKSTFELMLGEGSYDEIFETVKATRFMVQIYAELMDGIRAETEKFQKNLTNRTNKYAKKK